METCNPLNMILYAAVQIVGCYRGKAVHQKANDENKILVDKGELNL